MWISEVYTPADSSLRLKYPPGTGQHQQHIPQFSITQTNTVSQAPGLPQDMYQGTWEGKTKDSLQKHTAGLNQGANADPSLCTFMKIMKL